MRLYRRVTPTEGTVEGFLEFAKTTKWETLRDFLVNGLTFEWNDKPSTEQFSILRDLLMLPFQPANENHDVVTLWRRIKDEVKGVVRFFNLFSTLSRIVLLTVPIAGTSLSTTLALEGPSSIFQQRKQTVSLVARVRTCKRSSTRRKICNCSVLMLTRYTCPLYVLRMLIALLPLRLQLSHLQLSKVDEPGRKLVLKKATLAAPRGLVRLVNARDHIELAPHLLSSLFANRFFTDIDLELVLFESALSSPFSLSTQFPDHSVLIKL